jgi:ABC-2 type transport system permease protein
MVFLCGLFFPVQDLPTALQPVSYLLPLTYGADLLHGAVNHTARMPVTLSFVALAGFCLVLFFVSLRNVRKRWIQ